MPIEAGKCFAKCKIRDEYKIVTETIATYPNIENVEYTTEEIQVKNGLPKWEKRKKENCESKDPNDCIIFCLVEVPTETRIIKLPVHPEAAGDAVYEEVERVILNDERSYTDWMEVICADDLTPDLVNKLQEALIEQGYTIAQSTTDKVFGPEIKMAIVAYQKANGLPIGQLDLQTLRRLGISVN